MIYRKPKHRMYAAGDVVIVSTHARAFRMRVSRDAGEFVLGWKLHPGTMEIDFDAPLVQHVDPANISSILYSA